MDRIRIVVSGMQRDAEHLAPERQRARQAWTRWSLLLFVGTLFVLAAVAMSAQRQRARKEAESLRFAEQFVGILGHDLRNPMNAIAVTASLLKRRAKGAETPELDRILSSTARMSNMVAQLLDLTRSRLGGGIVVDRKAITLTDVVGNAVDELQRAQPGREIRCSLAPDIRGEWDGERLAQVVSNLVGNALQHGDPARPVEARLTADERECVFEVRSFGPPIPPALLSVIFDPYRRGEARGGKSQGLGLGLFISQQIVLAHDGWIDIASSEQDGTTFRVHLPRSGSKG